MGLDLGIELNERGGRLGLQERQARRRIPPQEVTAHYYHPPPPSRCLLGRIYLSEVKFFTGWQAISKLLLSCMLLG